MRERVTVASPGHRRDGIASIGGLAAKALIYFFAMTVTALALGLIVGNIVAPGSGFEGFQAALRDPSIVEEATERALRGEEIERMDGRPGGRFERDRAKELVAPGR